MSTIVAATRYIGNDAAYSIGAPNGDTKYVIHVTTADTGVYAGPQSMGAGSDFPATVTGSGGIGGYPLTPNQEYIFEITAMAGAGTSDNGGIFFSTANADGAVVSYFVTEKI